MDKIHFDQLNFRYNKAESILMMLAFILIIMNLLEFWTFGNPRVEKLLNGGIFVFLAIIQSKIFWYKNLVQWNKKGIMIKLNNSWGKSYKFRDIRNYDFTDTEFTLSNNDGSKKTFDLTNIEPASINKLKNILQASI